MIDIVVILIHVDGSKIVDWVLSHLDNKKRNSNYVLSKFHLLSVSLIKSSFKMKDCIIMVNFYPLSYWPHLTEYASTIPLPPMPRFPFLLYMHV